MRSVSFAPFAVFTQCCIHDDTLCTAPGPSRAPAGLPDRAGIRDPRPPPRSPWASRSSAARPNTLAFSFLFHSKTHSVHTRLPLSPPGGHHSTCLSCKICFAGDRQLMSCGVYSNGFITFWKLYVGPVTAILRLGRLLCGRVFDKAGFDTATNVVRQSKEPQQLPAVTSPFKQAHHVPALKRVR